MTGVGKKPPLGEPNGRIPCSRAKSELLSCALINNLIGKRPVRATQGSPHATPRAPTRRLPGQPDERGGGNRAHPDHRTAHHDVNRGDRMKRYSSLRALVRRSLQTAGPILEEDGPESGAPPLAALQSPKSPEQITFPPQTGDPDLLLRSSVPEGPLAAPGPAPAPVPEPSVPRAPNTALSDADGPTTSLSHLSAATAWAGFRRYMTQELRPTTFHNADPDQGVTGWGLTERERVYYTLFRVPWEVERMVIFGWLLCCDSVLAIVTFLPMRVLLSLFRALWEIPADLFATAAGAWLLRGDGAAPAAPEPEFGKRDASVARVEIRAAATGDGDIPAAREDGAGIFVERNDGGAEKEGLSTQARSQGEIRPSRRGSDPGACIGEEGGGTLGWESIWAKGTESRENTERNREADGGVVVSEGGQGEGDGEAEGEARGVASRERRDLASAQADSGRDRSAAQNARMEGNGLGVSRAGSAVRERGEGGRSAVRERGEEGRSAWEYLSWLTADDLSDVFWVLITISCSVMLLRLVRTVLCRGSFRLGRHASALSYVVFFMCNLLIPPMHWPLSSTSSPSRTRSLPRPDSSSRPAQNTGWIYHYIRSQEILKLYVVMNTIEILDRILCSFSVDALQSMGLSSSKFLTCGACGVAKGAPGPRWSDGVDWREPCWGRCWGRPPCRQKLGRSVGGDALCSHET